MKIWDDVAMLVVSIVHMVYMFLRCSFLCTMKKQTALYHTVESYIEFIALKSLGEKFCTH